MSKRMIFSRELKLEALRSLDSGKRQARELARELEIPRSPVKRETSIVL